MRSLADPDGAAKQIVQDLIEQLGFEVLYVGDITLSRLLEPLGMTWIHTAIAVGMGRDWALSVVRRDGQVACTTSTFSVPFGVKT